MQKTFNSEDFIKTLGEELINDFIKAGKTTHPCSVGSGREKALMNKLKNILPHGVGVGSGFVIDSFGQTSSQCDLIIYEEDFALKFVINDDENYAYYNCESVIAVGEIKSDATIADVEDAFKKLKRIKELKRQKPNGTNFRSYLSKTTICGAPSEIYNPQQNPFDQIFTFVLCKSLSAPLTSIAKKAKDIFETKEKYFNIILPIEGQAITYTEFSKRTFADGALNATALCQLADAEVGFNFFIMKLIRHIQSGRSVPLNNQQYIQLKSNFSVLNIIPI